MSFDLDGFLALPRLSALHVAPDGRVHLLRSVPDDPGTRFTGTVLQLDPEGTDGPRELTQARAGVAIVGHTPDGDLLLLDRRPDPAAPTDADAGPTPAALWRLPAAGGEARCLASAPAGIAGVRVAADSGTIALLVEVFPDATDLADDRERATARRTAGTVGVLVEGHQARNWDRVLGPRAPRLFVLGDDGALHDLTGDVGQALRDPSWDITADGRTIVTTWEVPIGEADARRDVVAFDVATLDITVGTGPVTPRVLASESDVHHQAVACSPDGRTIAVTRRPVQNQHTAVRTTLWLHPLDGSAEPRQLAPDVELWPSDPVWTPDGAAVLATAEENGRVPLWRYPVDPGDGPAVLRLCADGAFSDVAVGADEVVHALRSRIDTPPEVVRLAADGIDQRPEVRHAEPVTPAGRTEEVTTTAADGTPLRAWLVLPEAATADAPAPLVVFVHGGPLSTWAPWSWRWQPQVFAARGYAVLLPDPALSTGYGQHMIQRGWAQWGGAPYDDVMALTDAALARRDLDADRTAVMGGSYGGYLTNWIIGHTHRFRAAVSHASLWDLSAFRGVTDHGRLWERWWGDPRIDPDGYRHWSPSSYADEISTPTLVIHGEQDHRCPIGEGLAMYYELQRRDVPSAMLYLPDEGHWVLKPGNIRVWHSTVLSWLDRWVLDAPWRRPDLL